MYIPPHRRTAKLTRELRSEAGRWLRELREKRGLSQRQLAARVGAEPYTLISQLEHGRGRIPPERYLVWAHALGVDPRKFVQALMPYYDPVTYSIIFNQGSRIEAPATRARPPAPSAKIQRMRKRRPSTG
jgi:transcriptional regulator with XRE-family HTH domain